MQGVGLDGGNEDLATRDDGRTETTAELRFPRHRKIGREILIGEPAPLRIVPVGGPIERVSLLIGHVESGTFFQARFFGKVGRQRMFRLWGERVHPEELRLGITGAVVRTSVGEAIARQDTVETRAADPVIEVPVLVLVVDILDPGA